MQRTCLACGDSIKGADIHCRAELTLVRAWERFAATDEFHYERNRRHYNGLPGLTIQEWRSLLRETETGQQLLSELDALLARS
jgi:hypothetical protein